MNIEKARQELLVADKQPDDFNIQEADGVITVTPKWYWETKQIAKKEDIPIIEDVNGVAEFATITALDKDELAEMLVYALQRIDELEARMNG